MITGMVSFYVDKKNWDSFVETADRAGAKFCANADNVGTKYVNMYPCEFVKYVNISSDENGIPQKLSDEFLKYLCVIIGEIGMNRNSYNWLNLSNHISEVIKELETMKYKIDIRSVLYDENSKDRTE